jgi:hypothetical protein
VLPSGTTNPDPSSSVFKPRLARRRRPVTSTAVPDSSDSSRSSSDGSRRLQQAQAPKQRPGWTGLWWADAGGVGVAAGPAHAVHTVSTVMAVYSLDAATGGHVGEPRVVALQDLFAPVGAANCK